MHEPSPRWRERQAAIRLALIERWDPIGVGEEPAVRGEYDAYVPALDRLLVARRPEHEIFDFLWHVETQHMGLAGDREATQAFARHLVELFAQGSQGERI